MSRFCVHFWERGSTIEDYDANCVFRYSPNFGVLSVAGEYGNEVGRAGIFGVATG